MPGHLNLIKVQTDDARQSFQAGVYQVTVLLHNPSTFELSSTGFFGREQHSWFLQLWRPGSEAATPRHANYQHHV